MISRGRKVYIFQHLINHTLNIVLKQFLFQSRPGNAEVVVAKLFSAQNNSSLNLTSQSINDIFSQYNICILWSFTIQIQVPVSVWFAELSISVCLDLSISVTVSLFCDNYVWQISVLPIILLLQPD